GTLRSRQGINLPGAKLSVAAMSEEDIAHARWAIENDADFISLSFVRKPEDVLQLKRMVAAVKSRSLVIAKVEKPEAVERLEEIVAAADGIMVARGDLGVEIDVARMPVIQKQIIDACQRHKKPVIVATQMLDSMQRASHPTRAEATDVANAILDGTDACMLSGETAVGSYPVESVEMMNRIMLYTEDAMETYQKRRDHLGDTIDLVHPVTSAVVNGAGQIGSQLRAKMIVIATRSGLTALEKAKHRDFIPTVAVSDRTMTLRQMCLYWGITPLAGVPHDLDRELVHFIDDWGREHGVLKTGDYVVFVAGTKVSVGSHNQLWVHQVE
ncbi:MAG: pyruvate kinase, partial [Planctomycetales bacterium]|nr:pyruvate kinase [Planctomycetales bacterium]